MKPLAQVLMAALFLAAPAGSWAEPASFEIAIFQESFMDLGHPQTARRRGPLS